MSDPNAVAGAFSLSGRVVAVTGAAGLIGGELVRVLGAAGAHIAAVDNHPVCDGETIRAHLGLEPDLSCRGYRCDITEEAAVDALIEAIVSDSGRIDVLINCAAIDAKFDSSGDGQGSAALHDMPLDLWQKSVDVNMTGTFLTTRRVLQQMQDQGGGNIVNVASVYALVAPDQTLYGDPDAPGFRPKPVDYVATKSFVPNFTRYIASTYGRRGIRANSVVPHGIETDHDDDFKRRFAQHSPLGRMCRLSEIGPPVLFLASDASSYMTGSTLVVDGGWTAW